MALKKSLSTFTLLGAAIAGIVGSGWLLGPMACAKIAGPAACIAWPIAGILMMVVAASFVILSRAVPITGGSARFFQISYGHFAGFSFSWIAWLAWVAVSPIETMALIQYSSNYIPHLMTTGVSPVLTPFGMTIAGGCMVIFSIINCFGTRTFGRINVVSVAFKLSIPAITAILLLSHHFHPHNFSSGGHFAPYGIKSIFSALPLAGIIYAFIGFNPAIQMAAEAKNPRRAIPIAIFGSLAVTIILYTCIQIAFIGALPSASFSHGWSALHFAGSNGPFVGLLTGLGFVWFVKALYVDSVVSPFGTGMVQSIATARLTYGMSKNTYFPKCFMKTNKHGAPHYATIFNMFCGFAFFLPFPSWQHMVGFLVSCLVMGYVSGPMSLMIMARENPQQFAGIPPKVIQAICLTAFYICNLMIFWSGWGIIYKVMIMFAIGYVVLAIKTIHSKQADRWRSLNIIRGSWVIIYMIGMSAISYCSSFGGHKIIPFGIDFIVMAIFSIAIYYCAHALASRKSYVSSSESV